MVQTLTFPGVNNRYRVCQDDCLMEWFDDTMDIVDKQPPLQSLLEAATPWLVHFIFPLAN